MPKFTKEERDWCLAFGERLGCEPYFDEDYYDDEVAQVTYILEIEKWRSAWRGADGNEVGGADHETITQELKLRKFKDSDCPDGWTAYLFSYSHCYLQGEPEPPAGQFRPQTPEEAVREIAEELVKEADEYRARAKRLADASK